MSQKELEARGWKLFEPKDDTYEHDAADYALDQCQTGAVYVHDDHPNEAISFHSDANSVPTYRHHVVRPEQSHTEKKGETGVKVIDVSHQYFHKVIDQLHIGAHLDEHKDEGFRQVIYNRWTRT